MILNYLFSAPFKLDLSRLLRRRWLLINASGELEDGDALAPLNAVSHVLRGDRAAIRERASVKYTLTGSFPNTAAVVGWAGMHQVLFARNLMAQTLPDALPAGSLRGSKR